MTIAETKRAWRLRNPDKVRAQKARYRERNRAELAEKGRAYYAANLEERRIAGRDAIRANPGPNRARAAAYYQLHREDANAARRARYAANIEQGKAAKRAYRETAIGKEGHWASGLRRNAAIKSKTIAPPTKEGRAWAAVLRAERCVYCGAVSKALDHIRAVADGGDNAWDNFAPACTNCNSAKRDKRLLVFLLVRPVGTTWPTRTSLQAHRLQRDISPSNIPAGVTPT